jgi:2,3-bisphosphoglycerate-dependent phosphoglycerate mutase
MSIGIDVAGEYFPIGTPSFFKSFFSTISARLEDDKWGTRFPAVMRDLYSGTLRPPAAAEALKELTEIRSEFSKLPPSQVVWDFEDRTARPPWGDRISKSITSLANYFVTSDGKDLFETLNSALFLVLKTAQSAQIQ